jgi:hypothetical protein
MVMDVEEQVGAQAPAPEVEPEPVVLEEHQEIEQNDGEFSLHCTQEGNLADVFYNIIP